MLELLRTASAHLFEQDWARAFRGCGFGSGQTGLTKHLKSRFPAIIPEGGVPAELLTLSQFQCVWPVKKEIRRVVVSWVTGVEVPALSPLDRSAHPKNTQPSNVWFGRLRSSSSSALPTPSTSSSGLTSAVPWPAPPSNSARPAHSDQQHP